LLTTRSGCSGTAVEQLCAVLLLRSGSFINVATDASKHSWFGAESVGSTDSAMVLGTFFCNDRVLPSPLTGVHVTSTGSSMDGAVQLRPAGVSETTDTSAGIEMVTVAVADCDPPPLLTTNGTVPTRSACSGRWSVESMLKSACWVVAHTAPGSTVVRICAASLPGRSWW
jgi:hypothetical protein